MKKAILQVADTGPLESFVVMLRSAGYECHLPTEGLRDQLRKIGGLVLSPRDLERSMGYSPPIPLPEADSMDGCDLYVDVKAHQTYHRLVERWPNLAGRVLWYRINGGEPEHVVRKDGDRVVEDCGDEVNPPCPVLTPNQWYETLVKCSGCGGVFDAEDVDLWCECGSDFMRFPPFYVCWPPFVRFGEYGPRRWTPGMEGDVGLCLLHNARGWGYQDMMEPSHRLGIRVYGRGSPAGLLPHREIKARLQHDRTYVHLKSNDAPGYALYEALASACPIILPRRLIWRCRMQELFVEGETCLCFDRETHDALTADDVAVCTAEIKHHLAALSDPEANRKIGEAGRSRLRGLMWQEDRDGPGLREWLGRMFP